MQNEQCLELFSNYLKNDKKASGNTLSSYMRDIRQLSDFLAFNCSVNISDASEEDLEEYITELRGLGKSVATVSRAIASIKGLYAYLTLNRYIDKNPSCKLVPEKNEHKLPEILTSKEVELLLNQPKCIDLKGYRDKAMLELLYATGIRVSELINLNMEDVNINAGIIHIYSKNKDRFIPMYPAAINALSTYIELVRPQMIADSNEASLFVNVNGERMSRQGFWKLIKSYQRSAGIEKDITPHTLRHSFAAHLLENGADIKSIQEMLGHVDISSTQVYSQLVKKEIKDIYNKAHPMA